MLLLSEVPELCVGRSFRLWSPRWERWPFEKLNPTHDFLKIHKATGCRGGK